MSNFSFVARGFAQEGVATLNASQDLSIILVGNPASTSYRKSVFPGLNSWMRSVFVARDAGLLSEQEAIDVFSFVKSKAVVGINNYRVKQQVKVQALTEENVQLKAQLKQAMFEKSKATRAARKASAAAQAYNEIIQSN